MKLFIAVACVLVFGAALASGHFNTKNVKEADDDLLQKQKFVLNILQHIHQDDIFDVEYMDIAKNFVLKDYVEKSESPESVKYLTELLDLDKFTDEEYMFTVFSDYQVKHLKALSDTLYYAKDFTIFKQLAIWARVSMNKQLFLNAFGFAVLHRKDMAGVVLPAPYEIYPWYFFDGETIQKAEKYYSHGFHHIKKNQDDVYAVEINANYTGDEYPYNVDSTLSYYLEDVGLNSFYYYYSLDYPYWSESTTDRNYKLDNRGELFAFTHWQLLARYYMERLSNDLGEINELNFYNMVPTGYDSKLINYNGIAFPNRENNYNFYKPSKYDMIDDIETIKRRLVDSIDREYLIKEGDSDCPHKAANEFGNIMEGNMDSKENHKWFKNFNQYFRKTLNTGKRYNLREDLIPNALMHYETSLRDPVFYEMSKYMLKFYWKFMDNYEAYTKENLKFKGVKIEKIEMDKLVTFFDDFDSDISNAVNVETFPKEPTTLNKFGRLSHHEGSDFLIEARQRRLNHLPFNLKLTVMSDKAQKAVVKVFLAPKHDNHGNRLTMEENRFNFLELEQFIVDLTDGKNVITRNSNDFTFFVRDRTTYYELYQKVMMATNTPTYKFPMDMTEAHCGLPQRILLPKGKRGGMPFQFFYMLYPFTEPKIKQFTGFDPTVSCGIGSGARFMDDSPFGFPFERTINDYTIFHTLDNMKFYDTMIYHKTENDINASN